MWNEETSLMETECVVVRGNEGEKSGEMLITGNIYDECVLGT